MEATSAWYVGQRAEQLAILHLSRRDDLAITQFNSGQNYGLDLLVNICKNGKLTGRVFGVQIKARLSLRVISHGLLDANEVKVNIGEIPILKDIPFPVCLFLEWTRMKDTIDG
jgi:hypothetical protein